MKVPSTNIIGTPLTFNFFDNSIDLFTFCLTEKEFICFKTYASSTPKLPKKSIEEINSLLKDYPNDPFFLELKAQILSENGKVKDAIKYYKKALKKIPNTPLIMLPLCSLLLEDSKNLKDIKEANTYLNFIVKKEPENIFAWHLKGISHNRLGQPIYANLSAAEEFLRRRDFKNAKYFAKKVISATKKFSSENLRASDIINLINEI